MIRIAAVGDIHASLDSRDTLCSAYAELHGCADVFLLAGDLTKLGTVAEVDVLVAELRTATVPCVAVLGNHDYESDSASALRDRLERAGVRVLEGSSDVIDVDGTSVGIAGTKGFGGGFAGAHGSDFGEPEMKAFIRHTQRIADDLFHALDALRTDVRIALLHFAPVKDTLGGERLEIYPFLGSYLLGEAIDQAGADLVVHGHAHHGIEHGTTPGGIPVRNVAAPVINRAFKLYAVSGHRPSGDRAV
jgi:Icc-related predicted phosphoesterase